ncbi:uncharacterized protein [Epargyreus clarus]
MNGLARFQRLISRGYVARAQNVWTPDNIVKSPYAPVEIPNATVPEYIWRNIHKWADKTAVVCGITNRSYTYRKLHEYAQNFAATLRTSAQLQIKDGDVIGVMMPNSPEYPIAVLGAMQAGAIVTTFNPIHTTSEVYRQLLLARPKIIIGSPETIGVIKEAISMSNKAIPVITVRNPEDNLPSETIAFEELMNNNVDKSVLNDVKRKPEDLVFLPYSSGTTGLPKGVELTNRNKVANFVQQEVEGGRHYIETTSEHQDSIMAVLPFYHVYGLSIILLHKLGIGAKLVVLPKFKPTTFLKALTEHKINLLYTAPPLALFLGTHPDVKKEHLNSVDRIICAAAPISKSDIRRLLDKCQPDIKFCQIYGLTEVSPLATTVEFGSDDHTSVGYALPNTELRVVDPNDRHLGPDEVGELHIRGPHIMKGYRDNPEATKTAITDDGWFRSGDLVSINKDGAVTIVDRIKELIKVKGYQVPPAELEGILRDHPDILDAAVIGIPDERKGEAPKAFVVLKEGHKTTATNIIEFVSKQVADYKRIKEVQFLDELPRNPSGKLLRKVLKEKYQ